MNQLTLRILSAVFALSIPIICSYWEFTHALIGVGLIVIFIGIHEYAKICFSDLAPKSLLRLVFLVSAGLLSLLTIFVNELSLFMWMTYFPFCLTLFLWTARSRGLSNEALLRYLSRAGLGLVYTGLSPALILKVLLLPDGFIWFWFLLITVFSGDTGAFFGGKMIGGPKLMAALSPKKTISGALCGTLCSLVLGSFFISHFFSGISLWNSMGLCLLISILAQSGDLFESLIKRVAQVKDSGSIMPGHGGALDRLDGLYFAAPLGYAAAQLYTQSH